MRKKIRTDAERAYELRIIEMKKAQDEARAEIQLAKFEAELAATEKVHSERKAEEDRPNSACRAEGEDRARNQGEIGERSP